MRTMIAIPVFNGEKFIERTMESCIRQTTPAHILVVDNASTDRTLKLIQPYLNRNFTVELVTNEDNIGRTQNWNKCIEIFERTDCELIRFLFAGDELMPDAVEVVENYFDRYQPTGAIVHPYDFIKLDGETILSEIGELKGKFLDCNEVLDWTFNKGGFLGALVCDTYVRGAILGNRFNNLFVVKNDFDAKVMFGKTAYYGDQSLAKFNLDCHQTFSSANSYLIKSEFSYAELVELKKIRSQISEDMARMFEQSILLRNLENTIPYLRFRNFPKLFSMCFGILFYKTKNILIDSVKEFFEFK